MPLLLYTLSVNESLAILQTNNTHSCISTLMRNAECLCDARPNSIIELQHIVMPNVWNQRLKSAESEIKINKQHYKCWSHAYCIVALVIDSHDTYICWQSARDHRSFVHIVWTATSFCRPSIRWTMDGALARDIVTFTQHHRSVFWCVRCFCYRWLQQNIIFIIITLYIWI